jgi:hypothetical protein
MPHYYHKNSLQMYHNSPRNKKNLKYIWRHFSSTNTADLTWAGSLFSHWSTSKSNSLPLHLRFKNIIVKQHILTLHTANTFFLFFSQAMQKKCVHKKHTFHMAVEHKSCRKHNCSCKMWFLVETFYIMCNSLKYSQRTSDYTITVCHQSARDEELLMTCCTIK